MQLGPGTIVTDKEGGHKVAAHYRGNSRHRGYIITEEGEWLWDDQVEVKAFVPPSAATGRQQEAGGAFTKLIRRWRNG